MSDENDNRPQSGDGRPKAFSPILDAELERIHDFSTNNRFAYGGSATAGCFYCCEIWEPSGTAIAEFCDCEPDAPDEIGNASIICPFCSVDSVIASIDVGEVTEELLTAMNEYFF
jgi:hypothetical protein